MSQIEMNTIEKIMSEMIEGQKKLLLHLGREIVPTLTSEDMLQPNDYPVLENHPHFRYEEGILAGLQSLQMAIRSLNLKKAVTHGKSPQSFNPQGINTE